MDWSTSARCFACRVRKQTFKSNTTFTEKNMLSKIDEKREQIKHEIRPLDPVQPSEPHACLWVQGRDQEVLGEDAGRAVGAVGAAGAEDAVDAEGAEDAEVEDAA